MVNCPESAKKEIYNRVPSEDALIIFTKSEMLVYRHNPLYMPKAKNEDSLITIATEKVEKK